MSLVWGLKGHVLSVGVKGRVLVWGLKGRVLSVGVKGHVLVWD